MKWPICSRNRLNNGFYGTVDTNYLVGWKELHVFCVFIISYLLLIHIQWQSGQCSSYVLCCRHLSVIMWIPVNPTALFCFQANFHKSLQDPVQYNAPWGFKKKKNKHILSPIIVYRLYMIHYYGSYIFRWHSCIIPHWLYRLWTCLQRGTAAISSLCNHQIDKLPRPSVQARNRNTLPSSYVFSWIWSSENWQVCLLVTTYLLSKD